MKTVTDLIGGSVYGIAVKWILLAVLILVIIASVLFYGHSRYNAGVDATDAKWVAAEKKLEKQAEAVIDKADKASIERIEEHQELVIAEKEKLDEAEQNGDSTMDVLFGTSD